jgi:hypothetical protein
MCAPSASAALVRLALSRELELSAAAHRMQAASEGSS